MRRLLLICLLVMLPFQFVWGAAAGYCQHEESAKRSHLGHHAHKHQDNNSQDGGLEVSEHATPDKKASAGAEDADCATCHLGCGHAVVSGLAMFAAETDRGYASTYGQAHPPLLPSLIDRPNWALAA